MAIPYNIVSVDGRTLVQNTDNLTQQLTNAFAQRAQNQRQDRMRNDQKLAKEAEKQHRVLEAELLSIEQMTDYSAKRKALAQLVLQESQQGRDPSQIVQILNAQTPDELNLGLRRVARAQGVKGGLSQKIAEASLLQTSAEQPEFEQGTGSMAGFAFDPATGDYKQSEEVKNYLEAERTAKGSLDDRQRKVKATEPLTGGGFKIVYDDGTTEVSQPTEEELKIIRNAEERGVELQQRRAKGRYLGTGAAKVANEALNTTDKLRSNNSALKKVIREVKAGAKTGALVDRLPSFRASTLRLKQLKNELGLDVVGSVTFGALSEGELQLALDTGLPTKLAGPELIKWAEEKINAQEKLSDYLEDQAIFLSRPGNTAADWIKKARDQKRLMDRLRGRVPQKLNINQENPIDLPLNEDEKAELARLKAKYGQ